MQDPPFAHIAVRRIAAPPAWDDAVARLRGAPGFWLLRGGAWTFAGAEPYAIARAFGERIEIEPCDRPGDATPLGVRSAWRGDAFEALRRIVARAAPSEAAAAIPFVGGAVGWLGYELAAQIERVPVRGGGDLVAPDAAWLLVDRVVAFDAASGRLYATALGATRDDAERAADRFAERVAHGAVAEHRSAAVAHDDGTPGPEPLRLRDAATGLELGAFFDADAYAKAIARIQDEIAAGEVYQANLTHRLAARFHGDVWRLFLAVRGRSSRAVPCKLGDGPPAQFPELRARTVPEVRAQLRGRTVPEVLPFAAFVELPELAVVGASPERFLRLDLDGAVETRPIKGTRPRGATPADDARLAAELLASEKERAENAMIVDLMRNDLGRVCETGSVSVPSLFAIEPHATLFQMVSTVRGTLRAGCDRVDLLRAAFPPGSMTGAPKIAAIELLAKLEPVRRGVYSGALGWLDARGGMDLAVVIRTLLCRGTRAWIHVGGGIVMDSDPRAEWDETWVKARALLDALAAAQD